MAFQKKRGVTFPVMQKTDVNGENADPAFKYLRDNSSMNGGNIMWNFAKFLVNADGDVVATYPPTRKPESIKSEIEQLLSA